MVPNDVSPKKKDDATPTPDGCLVDKSIHLYSISLRRIVVARRYTDTL